MESLKHFKLLSPEEILEKYFLIDSKLGDIHNIEWDGKEYNIKEFAERRKKGKPADYQMTVEVYLQEIHPDINDSDKEAIIKLFKEAFEDAEVENEDDLETCLLVIDSEEKNIWAYSLCNCI